MGCVLTYFQKMSTLTPQECIDKLREIEAILYKMQEKYRLQIDDSKKMAKQYVRDDNRILAKAAIRRSKMLEHQIGNIAQRLYTCEQQRLAIEQINTMNLQVDMMNTSARTFKAFLKQNDLDKIQSLQDSLQQAILDTCDINETLNEDLQPLMFDDDELESELRSLMLTTSIHDSFPSTPEIAPTFEQTPSPLGRHNHSRKSDSSTRTAIPTAVF